MPEAYAKGEAAYVFTITETEHESKVDAVSTIRKPERPSKWAASDPTVNVLEWDFGHFRR